MARSLRGVEFETLPKAKVVYEPEYQVLFIENGAASEVGEEMANGVLVLYDKDVDDAPTSAVAIRIDRAEVVLKPFVEAILAKYGIKHEESAQGMDTKAADD